MAAQPGAIGVGAVERVVSSAQRRTTTLITMDRNVRLSARRPEWASI